MAPYYITSMLSFICHDGEICGEAWHSSVSQSRGVREHDGLTTTLPASCWLISNGKTGAHRRRVAQGQLLVFKLVSSLHLILSIFSRNKTAASFLKDYHSIAKRPIRIPSPHRPKRLQERYSISALSKGKRP